LCSFPVPEVSNGNLAFKRVAAVKHIDYIFSQTYRLSHEKVCIFLFFDFVFFISKLF